MSSRLYLHRRDFDGIFEIPFNKLDLYVKHETEEEEAKSRNWCEKKDALSLVVYYF